MRISSLVRIALLAVAAGCMLASTVQSQPTGKVYRIGFLRAGAPPKAWVEEFQQGLRERGYVEGQNLLLMFRFTDGSIDPLPQLAEELVRSKVDVILASAGPPALAAKKATTSVPIVFVNVIDPVEIGLVRSLGSPGGNLTGLAMSSAGLTGKRLEVLKELVPKLRRVAVLSHTATPSTSMQLKGAEAAARTLGLRLQVAPVVGPDDFDAAFKTVRGADGLLQLDSLLFTTHRDRLVGLAATNRLPAIYGYREMAEVGGLMSYGAHFPDMYRRAATYVDKILKGGKPADLPVEQPAKFEFVINLKTANALGLTFPRSLLLRADQVLE